MLSVIVAVRIRIAIVKEAGPKAAWDGNPHINVFVNRCDELKQTAYPSI